LGYNMLMQSEQEVEGKSSEAQPTWTFSGADQPADADDVGAQAPAEPVSTEVISWTASEFIAHSKTALWYIGLLLVTVGALGLVLLVSGDKFVMGIIVIISILFGYMASRKPRELPYSIDSHGLNVDKKQYPFSKFKSYSLVDEGGVEAIWLMPLQRFAPGLSIYFDPGDRNKILDMLGDYLPIEERKPDIVDVLTHKIRF
jgi:hypothetical protein